MRFGRPVRHGARARMRVLDQLRLVPRRIHAHRPDPIRGQAQRDQRREQYRRIEREPLRELRCRGAVRRPGDHPQTRAGRHEHARHADAVAGHADDAGGRRIRQLAKRQQQRLCAGQRHHLAELGLDVPDPQNHADAPPGDGVPTAVDTQVAGTVPSRGVLHAAHAARPVQAVEPRAMVSARRHHADGSGLVRHDDTQLRDATALAG